MGGPERVTRPEAGTDVHEATRGTLAARIRLYELARELGLSNKETLDLCVALGIGVKSHSSSIEDAQADRVRRKADREGLRRPVQPEEPKKGGPADLSAPVGDDIPGPADGGARPGDQRRLVTSSPTSEYGDFGSRPSPPRSAPLREPTAPAPPSRPLSPAPPAPDPT